MIDTIIESLVSGYLFDRLLKLIPPKKKSEFDSILWDQLRSRNDWIDTGGLVIYVVAFLGLSAMVIALGADAWRAGLVFGFPIFLFFLFVGTVTLKDGFQRFREYWRYHELKHRIRLAMLLSLYIPLAALGLVSAFEIFA